MILTKKVNKDDFYITYYRALNGILNLTNKEIEVLSKLSNIIDSDYDSPYISNSTRAIASEELGISIQNFNNLFKKLKDKGFIVETPKGLKINPFLYKKKESTEITFKFDLE